MSIMRTALLALARSQSLQNAIVRIPISRRAARRFVAGESLGDALTAARKLNAQGLYATLDHLGESVSDEQMALAAAEEYLAALDAMYLDHLHASISIKLTQMGLDLSDDFCLENAGRIVAKAAEMGNFVYIDMESSEYTERTLTLYRRLRQQYDNVGVAIQAYLHRSQADVCSLIAEGIGHFRLCKGAYDEPPHIAYQGRERVTRAMNELIQACLTPEARAQKAFCAVASHDEAVVNFTRAYAYQNQVPGNTFEFQMLYGIRRDLQARLVQQGYAVRVYVPYGTHWYPYFMRRLAERPANLLFFLRALVGA